MWSASSRSQRSSSSISPFRSRKSSATAAAKASNARPTTPTGQRLQRPAFSPTSTAASNPSTPIAFDRPDLSMPKESVTVTVRFRPLSAREINKGDEIAWYADGDYTLQNEYSPSIAYHPIAITLYEHFSPVAAEIETLKQEKLRLIEEKDGLQMHTQKLTEEASFAKELASAAAVELKSLAEEMTKLSYQNAKLTGDLAAANERGYCRNNYSQRHPTFSGNQDDKVFIQDLQNEIIDSCERESSLEAALTEKSQREQELQKRVEEAKRREGDLENELANMWVLVAKMRNAGQTTLGTSFEEEILSDFSQTRLQNGNAFSSDIAMRKLRRNDSTGDTNELSTLEELRTCCEIERRRCKKLEAIVTKLKSEDFAGLDVKALGELQSFHVEAITKICQAKVCFSSVNSGWCCHSSFSASSSTS